MATTNFRVFPGLDILGDNNTTSIINGVADPTVGLSAPLGSIYQRNVDGNGTVGEIWKKVGALDTEWALVDDDSALVALQGAVGANDEGSIDYSSNNVVTDGVDLVNSVSDLDTAIGPNFVPELRTDNNPVNPLTALRDNISSLDSAIGSDAQLASTSLIATTNSIYENLSSLDAGLAAGIAGINFLGTFDPANPTTNAPNGVSPTDGDSVNYTAGDMFVVDVAGFYNFTTGDQTPSETDNTDDLEVGDRLFLNSNLTWEAIENLDSVSSVFGRVGAVEAVSGDYDSTLISRTPVGNLEAVTVEGALLELQVDINDINAETYVNSFNTRTGDIVPEASDYDASQIDYSNATSGLTATDAQSAIDEIEGRVDTVEGDIGGSVTGEVRSYSPALDQAVNLNIEALDTAIGNDAEMVSTNFISLGQGVYSNLSDLDTQVQTNLEDIAALALGTRWLEQVQAITNDDLSIKSGTGNLSEDPSGLIYVPSLGDRVATTLSNEIYIVQSGTWTIAEDGALATGDTFIVENDLLNTLHQEASAVYNFDGTDLNRLGTLGIKFATQVEVASGYVPSEGNVGPVDAGDSVQVALEKLDGNTIDLSNLSGVARGDSDLGTFVGGDIISDNVDIKTALSQLEIAVEAVEQGATGEDVFQNAFIGKALGNELPDYGTPNVVTQNGTLELAITELDTEFGAGISTPQGRTIGPISDQAVNLNIEALDDAIGSNVTSAFNISPLNSVNANITALDSAIDTINNTAQVDSFNTRQGDVLPESGDYTSTLITRTAGGGIDALNVEDALLELQGDIDGINAVTYVNTFNTRIGDVLPEAGDYTALQVTYDNTTSGLTATTVKDALDEISANENADPSLEDVLGVGNFTGANDIEVGEGQKVFSNGQLTIEGSDVLNLIASDFDGIVNIGYNEEVLAEIGSNGVVLNNIVYPGVDGVAKQAITTDGAGVLGWSSFEERLTESKDVLLTLASTTEEKQALIDAQPKYIDKGVNLYFVFEAGTHDLGSGSLTIQGFSGGGRVGFNNVTKTSTHNQTDIGISAKDTKVTSSGTFTLLLRQNTCESRVYNLEVENTNTGIEDYSYYAVWVKDSINFKIWKSIARTTTALAIPICLSGVAGVLTNSHMVAELKTAPAVWALDSRVSSDESNHVGYDAIDNERSVVWISQAPQFDLDPNGREILYALDPAHPISKILEEGNDANALSIVNLDSIELANTVLFNNGGSSLTESAGSLVIDAPSGPLALSSVDNIDVGIDGSTEVNIGALGGSDINIGGLVHPKADGTAGQFLSTDGNGNLAFQDGAADGSDITTDTTNFDGLLSVADTTVQLALDTLDDVDLSSILSNGSSTGSNGIFVNTNFGILGEEDTGLGATGGTVNIIGGQSTTANAGGLVNIHGGTSTSGVGGDVEIDGGSGASAGDVVIGQNGSNAVLIGDTNIDVAIHGLIYPTSGGTNAQVLTSDGAGNLTFKDIPAKENAEDNVTTEAPVDTVLVDDVSVAKWLVTAEDGAVRNSFEVNAIHNGIGATDATVVDYSQFALLRTGGQAISGLSIDVVLNGVGSAQTMELRVTSGSSVNVRVTRIDVAI